MFQWENAYLISCRTERRSNLGRLFECIHNIGARPSHVGPLRPFVQMTAETIQKCIEVYVVMVRR